LGCSTFAGFDGPADEEDPDDEEEHGSAVVGADSFVDKEVKLLSEEESFEDDELESSENTVSGSRGKGTRGNGIQ